MRDKDIIAFEFLLENKDWTHSSDIKDELGFTYSKLKKLCLASEGTIARIAKSYKLSRNFTQDDLNEFVEYHNSIIQDMISEKQLVTSKFN